MSIFLRSMQNEIDTNYNEAVKSVQYIENCRFASAKGDAAVYRLILSKNHATQAKALQELHDNITMVKTTIGKYSALPINSGNKSDIDAVNAVVEQYMTINQEIIALVQQGKNDKAYKLYTEQGYTLQKQYNSILDKLAQVSNEKMAASQRQETGQIDNYQMELLIGSIVAAIIIFFFALAIVRRVQKRLMDIKSFFALTSKGDFSHEIPAEHLCDKSEFGEISRAGEGMQSNVCNLLGKIKELTEHITQASDDLSNSSQQTAQASAQIADSVTSVADLAAHQQQMIDSNLQDTKNVSDSVKKFAASTQTVIGTAKATLQTSQEGNQVVDQTITQMQIITDKTDATSVAIKGLEEKSKAINQIVEVILSISEQTNLLALNAAIEAARAGEAGKGFSVVADEVRKLAEQSQSATKKITELIADIQEETNNAVSVMNENQSEVQAGSQIVMKAGQKFSGIRQMIEKIKEEIDNTTQEVDEIIGHINNIATGANQIEKGSKEISGETQNISAAAEEIAGSSQNMLQLSQDLKKLLDKFKVLCHRK